MIKVMLNRVLCKPDELEKKSKSGIILEYGEKEKRYEAGIQHGTIVSVGDKAWEDWGSTYIPQLGDRVLWAKYSGVGVIDPDTGEKLVILNDEDVLCVLSKGEV